MCLVIKIWIFKDFVVTFKMYMDNIWNWQWMLTGSCGSLSVGEERSDPSVLFILKFMELMKNSTVNALNLHRLA